MNSSSATAPMLSLSHSVISGGSFMQYNDNRQFHIQSGPKGVLEDAVAPGAFHNSGDRFDPPKCHPNTRVAVMNKIMDWILGQDPETKNALIMWLNGAAGAGKSAIAQSIAELCFSEDRLLATFFFGRSDPHRNHAKSLFATIAYQMVLALPQIRVKLAAIVQHDPLIFTRSLPTQFLSLIVEPLRDLSSSDFFNNPASPRLIIIDGLDECLDRKVQCEILDIILSGIQQHRLPLIFLVASRPEYDISTQFGSPKMSSVLTRLTLDDSYLPDEDIALFLRDKFAEIKETHPLKKSIPTPWPTDDVIGTLVSKSSGQFIYASTVVKYIESIRHRPHHRLEIVLNIRPAQRDLPFSELDALYTHIFASVEEIDQVLNLISLRLLIRDGSSLPIEDIENIFSLDPGDVQLLFCELGAVVSIRGSTPHPDPDYLTLRISHASLSDFLFDRSRSKEFHIEIVQRTIGHLRKCFQYLTCSPFPDVPWGAPQFAMNFIIMNLDSCILSPELCGDILRFSIGRIYEEGQRNASLSLLLNRRFLAPFFAFLKHSKFESSDQLYIHQLRSLDEVLSHHLEIYYSDTRLTLLVSLIDFIRVKRPWYFQAEQNIIPEFDRRFQLFDADTDLVVSDEKLCSLFGIRRTDHLRLIFDFLKEKQRSGPYALDGDKIAVAALTTLKYLCDHHLTSQTLVPRNTRREIKIRRMTPWMWLRRVGRYGALEKTQVWLKKRGDRTYREKKFRFISPYDMENPVIFQRVWSEKYSLGLEYFLYFLPRSGRSEELIEFATRHTFASRSQEFPNRSKKARRAITAYLERTDHREF